MAAMLAAILGHEIKYTLSPAIYNAAFPALGWDVHYDVWDVPASELPSIVWRARQHDVLGFNVTRPHKEAVMALLDEIDPAAQAIGAVNTIVRKDARLIAHNTDLYGFMRSLREAGCEPAGLSVVMLGTGGAARAVGTGLAEGGVREITLVGRSPGNLGSTAARIGRAGDGKVGLRALPWADADELRKACLEADLIVNCTPIGTSGSDSAADSPIPADYMRSGVWVYNLVYDPEMTPLLRQAWDAGGKPIGGLEMLIYQAEGAIRLWTDLDVPPEVVDIIRDACRAALKARHTA
jgi:shikimate dehydrogenase